MKNKVIEFPAKQPVSGEINDKLTEEQKKGRLYEILDQLEFMVGANGSVLSKEKARELHNKKLEKQLENRNKI